MSKHLDLHIEDDRFTFARKDEQIAAEAALDGIYILRASVNARGRKLGVRAQNALHAGRNRAAFSGPASGRCDAGSVRSFLLVFRGEDVPALRGYSRDERRGSLQIVYGLLCDREGRPIAVEVFKGNTLDHQTVQSQIEKLKTRFGLRRVVFVSDRGMVTTANLDHLRERDIDWITALKAPQVKALRAATSVSAKRRLREGVRSISRSRSSLRAISSTAAT